MFDAATIYAEDPRYRCLACGNVTRFDVVSTRRTRAFHHYTIGGELAVEEVEVLDEEIERVTCRWCNASDQDIEIGHADDAASGGGLCSEELDDQTS